MPQWKRKSGLIFVSLIAGEKANNFFPLFLLSKALLHDFGNFSLHSGASMPRSMLVPVSAWPSRVVVPENDRRKGIVFDATYHQK